MKYLPRPSPFTTLEQHQKTGKTYALKKLSKGFVVKTKMQEGVRREKTILSICDSDFIIKLFATFKDSQHLYFLRARRFPG